VLVGDVSAVADALARPLADHAAHEASTAEARARAAYYGIQESNSRLMPFVRAVGVGASFSGSKRRRYEAPLRYASVTIEHHFNRLIRHSPYTVRMYCDDVQLSVLGFAVGCGMLHPNGSDMIPGRQAPARPAHQGQVTVLPRINVRHGGARGKDAYAREARAPSHHYSPE
jgi:hypothetical protein